MNINPLSFFSGKDKEYTEEELKQDNKLLHKSVKDGNTKQVKKILGGKKGKQLLTMVDELDQTCLMNAARNNNIEMFELVLSHYRICKVDINLPDKNGYTCLHHFFSMAADIDIKMVIILLEADDIQVNVTNRDSNTPFHYFCQKFRAPNNAILKEVFEILLKKNVNINAINKNGESPLHKAIFNTTVAQGMITLLLENKANVNYINKNGESPLHYCVRLGRADLVMILLQYGADRTIIAKDNKPLYQIAIEENFTKLADLLRDGGDLSQINDSSSTELLSLLQNPTLREDFRVFLRDELICEENINFWTDVEAYKYLKVDANRLLKEFHRISEKYLAESSPSEINVPFSIKFNIANFKKTLPTVDSNPSSPILSGSNNSSNSNSNNNLNNCLDSPCINSHNNNDNSSNSNNNNSNNNNNNNNNNNSSFSIAVSSSPSFTNNNGSESPTISGISPSTSSCSLSMSAVDYDKLQKIFNVAQHHIFNLMASDSLSKYKKKSFLNK
ncbi:hypothetical protein CYY_005020 [Polysphondylium violaceum]|uniref:RGS domain-containing protein n=1 Tax=Polysphondylium violaceum TaxID=133409 RepID=A0A8J4PUY7_9MYCE|nr:hypothetical protein CYY_005020 [Polysphondylium violaceum]